MNFVEDELTMQKTKIYAEIIHHKKPGETQQMP